MSQDYPLNHWDEETSKRFLDYGRYFIPGREQQMQIMTDLLGGLPKSSLIMELGCGEGLLAEKLLNELIEAHYLGLDGSTLMLDRASERLKRFGARCRLNWFDLADTTWRRFNFPIQAVVSSLTIHHLREDEKQVLFKDMAHVLEPGGAFIISDMIEPTNAAGMRIAADGWDDVVRQRSAMLDGTTEGYDFFTHERWNTYRYPDPDDIDHPSGLYEQLKWLEQAGFVDIDVHFFMAGHALFSAWKK